MARRMWVEEKVRIDADVVAFKLEKDGNYGLYVYHGYFARPAYYFYSGQASLAPSFVLKLKRVICIDGSDSKAHAQGQLELRSTPCNLGGQRWWFVCSRCRKNRKHLYWDLESGWFACRVCLRIKYSSQCDNYRWDTGWGPGLRYRCMRGGRSDIMRERWAAYRHERRERYNARHRPAA